MGILIGKRGQTLDSLQYLANRVANKHQSGYVRVKLDTENYRARREETLRHLAKNIAHKVKRNRRPVVLEPMNPYERRIIHSALQSDPYVTTHSEGEEPYRKVVVTLKRWSNTLKRKDVSHFTDHIVKEETSFSFLKKCDSIYMVISNSSAIRNGEEKMSMSMDKISGSETIAAISTGMTNSGIGIVRISGDDAFRVAERGYTEEVKKYQRQRATESYTDISWTVMR